MCISIFIIHSFVGRHFGWLHMLAIVNKRAENLDVLVSGGGTNSLDICLGVLHMGHMAVLFSVLGDSILTVVVAVLIFTAASSG